MAQIARNLTGFDDGFATGKSHLIIDRDKKFTAKFKEILDVSGVENKLLTPREFSEKGTIECRSDLGGMLNYYYRKAA